MPTFTKSELLLQREVIRNTIEFTVRYAGELFVTDKIDDYIYQVIGNEVGKLMNELIRLDLELFRMKVTEIMVEDDSPGAQLVEATAKLEAAAKQLERWKQFINSVDQVLKATSEIIRILIKIRTGGII